MSKNISQKGFTYIDVLCGVVILFIGIIALTTALTSTVVRTREGEQHLIAKQYAGSTLESIFSARDLNVPGFGWEAVGNADSNPGFDGLEKGIFLPGKRPIYSSGGVDRIVGTLDDKCDASGIDNATGNCNNAEVPPITGFQREIVITDICDPDRLSAGCPGAPTGSSEAIMMRKVTVTIYFLASGFQRKETDETIIANLKEE